VIGLTVLGDRADNDETEQFPAVRGSTVNAVVRRGLGATLLTVVFASTSGVALASGGPDPYPTPSTRSHHGTVNGNTQQSNGNGSTTQSSGSNLPFTGANIVPDTIAGLCLVGVGAGAVIAGRRRRVGRTD
jgi:hypothetical protein